MSNANIETTIAALRDVLGERLSTGPSILDQHSHDEAYTRPVLPDAVAFPETTEEVSQILKTCSQHGCPVIPYGIGSSLEGHIVPIHGGITVDTSRMNKVLQVNESDLDAVVEPGVTRVQLNEELRATGLMFTVDPGADATLGGMAATRASGTNTVRYGTMADNVLALEVVLPDGQIIETGSRARKSSSGYDLTHLFVGSEGTLGLITKLTVKLRGQPEHVAAATCAFPDIESAVNTVILAIQNVSHIVSTLDHDSTGLIGERYFFFELIRRDQQLLRGNIDVVDAVFRHCNWILFKLALRYHEQVTDSSPIGMTVA